MFANGLNMVCNALNSTNTYTPKVQSTVRPAKKSSYNEIHEHIRKQLKR